MKSRASKSSSSNNHNNSNDNSFIMDPINPEKTNVLLLALLCESRKQSIVHYKKTTAEYKAAIKIWKERMRKFQNEQYAIISSALKESEKLVQLNNDIKTVSLENDSDIIKQRDFIMNLYEKIEALESYLTECFEMVKSMDDYDEIKEQNAFNDTVAALQAEIVKLTEKNEQHILKIQNHHQKSLFLASQKVHRLTEDIENIASIEELARLPKSNLDIMISNRILSIRLEDSKKESKRMDGIIRELEDDNMEYITCGLEIDWNLMCGIEEYSAGDDYITDLGDDDEWVLSEYAFENIDEEFKLEWNAENNSSKALKKSKRNPFTSTEIDDVEKWVNMIFEAEQELIKKESEAFLINGKSMQLETVVLEQVNPIPKFYESKLELKI